MTSDHHNADGIDSVEIEVPDAEIVAVAHMAQAICAEDERDATGHVLLTIHNGRRCWMASDSYRIVAIEGPLERAPLDVMVSPRLLHFAAMTVDGVCQLSIDRGPRGTSIRVSTGSGALTLPVIHEPVAAFGEVMFAPRERAAWFTADAQELRRFVEAARRPPHTPPDEGNPLFWLGLVDGKLRIEIDWDEMGTSAYEIRGEGEGHARTAVNPWFFVSTLNAFDGTVTVQLTSDPDGPLVLTGPQRRAVIVPIQTSFEIHRRSVDACVAAAFGPMVLHRDGDGDYPIVRHGIPIYARLIDDVPVTLQVFASLLTDVELTDELARELNDLNVGVSFARLMWVEHQVLAEVDLVASTLGVDELRTAVDRIGRVARDLVPALAAVFGGEVPDLMSGLWGLYRDTIIEAELWPARTLTLTGPDAIAEWDLPEESYVLTADNPYGVNLSDEVNADANLALAGDIRSAGGSYVRARGSSPDRQHVEQSFLVWGIDREQAIELGRQHRQDAIFALGAEYMSLLSCVDGREQSWPRGGKEPHQTPE